MLSAANGFHGSGEVRVIWGGDGYAVEFVAHGGEHLAEILEDLCVRVEGFGLFEALAVHVAECDDFCTCGGVGDIAGPFSTDTDSTELEFFRGLRAHVGEEQRARGEGKGFDEGTTLEG